MRTHRVQKLLRPDSKGRICLGNLAKGVSSFKITIEEDSQKIILSPYAEIPLNEKWLFDNEDALSRVKEVSHNLRNINYMIAAVLKSTQKKLENGF